MDYIDPVLSIDYPPGWVDLPTDPKIGTRSWFETFIQADTAPDVPANRVRAIAEGMVHVVKNSATREPDALIVYWPDLLNIPLAICEMVGYPFNGDEGPTDISEAVKWWGKKTEGTVGDVSVELRTLPAGPAARMRRMDVDKQRFRKGTVVERVIWAVNPPGLKGTIFITVSWMEIARGETLSEQADLVAEGLTIIESPQNI